MKLKEEGVDSNGKSWYHGSIGEDCHFWASEKTNEVYLAIYNDIGKTIRKKYEYMPIDKLIEIIEKYLLLI